MYDHYLGADLISNACWALSSAHESGCVLRRISVGPNFWLSFSMGTRGEGRWLQQIATLIMKIFSWGYFTQRLLYGKCVKQFITRLFLITVTLRKSHYLKTVERRHQVSWLKIIFLNYFAVGKVCKISKSIGIADLGDTVDQKGTVSSGGILGKYVLKAIFCVA